MEGVRIIMSVLSGEGKPGFFNIFGAFLLKIKGLTIKAS